MNYFNLKSRHPDSFKFQILNRSLELLLNYDLNLRQNWPFSSVRTSSLFSQRSFLLSCPAVMDTFTARCTHKLRSVQSSSVHLTEQPEGHMSVMGPDAVWRPFFLNLQHRLAEPKSFKRAAQGISDANVFMHVKYAKVTHLFFFLRNTTRQDTTKIKRVLGKRALCPSILEISWAELCRLCSMVSSLLQLQDLVSYEVLTRLVLNATYGLDI